MPRLLTLLFLLLPLYAHAAEDDVVLLLPSSKEIQHIKRLELRLENDASNTEIIDALVSSYIAYGKAHSDGRYYGFAKALLQPIISRGNAATILRVHWADILQHEHYFAEALVVLNAILKSNPEQARALLLRSVIYQVAGDYDAMRADCQAIISSGELFSGTICLAQSLSLTGKLTQAIAMVDVFYARYKETLARDKAAWISGVLAEMFLRQGEYQQAALYVEQALDYTPHDYYLLALYADILIADRRYNEVEEALNEHRLVDTLMLRIAVANNLSTNFVSQKNYAELESIIARNDSVGDTAHLRIPARYYLDVKPAQQKAYVYALKNWQYQKEPADILLLLRAAIANKCHETIAMLRKWVNQRNIEDTRISELLEKVQ